MNIFVLNENPSIVVDLVDKHIVKMPLETAQMLCTVSNTKGVPAVYKSTHVKHPAVLWTMKSPSNWDWLCEHGMALCKEYTFRYNKIHKCQQIIADMKNRTQAIHGTTKHYSFHDDFVLCMPEQYKTKSAVESYRKYYRAEKFHIAKWKNRNTPQWWV